MKKHISLVLAFVLLALCLTGCATQSANSSSEEDTLSQVMSSGKLVAAFEIGDEPWGYTDPATGNYTGFAVELISGFAASIGVAVERSAPTSLPAAGSVRFIVPDHLPLTRSLRYLAF